MGLPWNLEEAGGNRRIAIHLPGTGWGSKCLLEGNGAVFVFAAEGLRVGLVGTQGEQTFLVKEKEIQC